MEVCVGGALKVGETFICEFICERVLDVFIGKGKSILEKKKFEKQFIEIGNFISGFERQGKNGLAEIEVRRWYNLVISNQKCNLNKK